MLSSLEVADVFTPAECNRIIVIAQAGIFRDANLTGSTQSHATRLSQTSWLDDDSTADWIFQRMLKTFVSTNRKHFGFRLDEFSERMQVACYEAQPGGFFDWHIDSGAGALASRRKLTMVVQLSGSESYVGGQLETNADGHPREASRCIGSALVLPSFMLHRVRPVTSGTRYSLTLWSHGPAFQ